VTPRLVLLATSPRVAAGLLSVEAWRALQAGPILSADLVAPLAEALTAGGLPVSALLADGTADAIARELLDAARRFGAATWLADAERPEDIALAVEKLNAASPGADQVEVDVITASWDLPGARLLDVVTTMDRLRSPGGCPWDAQQDHDSLAPYLLEEAYEAFQAIEDADLGGLREELGDVLLQVAFHARMAEELPAGERWTIDDVANGLVDKLVRRHPHVFEGATAGDDEELRANWESIKAAERGDASVVANVPLAAPALTLAATLQRKAARAGLPNTELAPGESVSAAAVRFEQAPSPELAGELLWAAVLAMRALDIDAEAALRARARAFRDEVANGSGLGGLPGLNAGRR
jgi:XTP/dITP diphosphohydrolase